MSIRDDINAILSAVGKSPIDDLAETEIAKNELDSVTPEEYATAAARFPDIVSLVRAEITRMFDGLIPNDDVQTKLVERLVAIYVIGYRQGANDLSLSLLAKFNINPLV